MLINVTKRQIIVKVNEEDVNFNIKDAMKHLLLYLDYYFKADIVDQAMQQSMQSIKSFTPFEQVIANAIENFKRKESRKYLNQLKFINSKVLLKRREMRMRKTTRIRRKNLMTNV